MDDKDFIAAMQRGLPPISMPAPLACDCCGGTGWIGGPSYYQPDEGGEPCPDCEARFDAENGICAQEDDQ